MLNENITESKIPFRDLRLPRGDHFVYEKFTEKLNPELVMDARQVHARGYAGEGFIYDDAIDSDGSLSGEIDKARGDLVDYYLGYEVKDDNERVPQSTLRKINIPFGGTLDDLPAYQLCKDTIYPNELDFLHSIQNPEQVVKEISAFAHNPEVSALAGFELLRNTLQDSIGSHEIWIFSMVESRYESLVKNFGPIAVRKIGEPVPIDDVRVNNVRLVPAIVDTDQFLQQVHDTISKETDAAQKKRFMRSFYSFTESLTPDEMSDDVAALSGIMRSQDTVADPPQQGVDLAVKKEPGFGFETLLKTLERPTITWSQPDEFDFTSWADRREVKRRSENGEIIQTIDRLNVISDELFELRHADSKDDQVAASRFIESMDGRGIRSGRWFHFPWSQSLVHYYDQEDHQDLRTFRNKNIITSDEQAVLLDSKIMVAGLSVGSSIVRRLSHSGIGGTMILGDHDTLSLTNLNRVEAGMPQVGMAKIDDAAIRLSELDPYVRQVHFRDGITKNNLSEIAKIGPDIIFDEVDDLATKALLRQFASRHNVPLIMATDVGDKSIIDVERYDLEGTTMFNGRLKSDSIDEMLSGSLSPESKSKITSRLVGLTNASFRLIQSSMDKELAGFPQLDTTASVGGSLAAIAAREILSKRKLQTGRYVFSPKELLDLKNPTSTAEGIKIIRQYIKSK